MVTNIRTVNINKLYPGKVLLEGQGIQPDNEHMIFPAADITETEGTINWGGEGVFGREHWGDLYTTDLEGGSLVRLTSALYHHDENPEYSPDGSKIVWTQTQGGIGEKPFSTSVASICIATTVASEAVKALFITQSGLMCNR